MHQNLDFHYVIDKGDDHRIELYATLDHHYSNKFNIKLSYETIGKNGTVSQNTMRFNISGDKIKDLGNILLHMSLREEEIARAKYVSQPQTK